jgi:flagellar motor switch protein FliN/FliY
MSTQEIVSSVPTQEALQYLDCEIKRCLTSSLAAMLGGAPVSAERENTAAYPPDAVWFNGAFTGAATGSILFALDPEGAMSMGHKLLLAAGLEGETDDTALETLSEVLSQITGGLASSFLARVRKDVAAQPLAKVTAPVSPEHILSYRVTIPDGPILQISAMLDKSLVGSLTLTPPEPAAKTAIVTVPASSAGPSTRNLELLLDVELPVSVSFGRAQLQLKDVIKLTTGSIVELNRSVSEPVDIIVNNCVIARGEVVVVEGNFGVRIKQIVSKEDRLRSLG